MHSTNYTTFNLTDIDGLSQNIVTCIYQDSAGLLWIGTIDGLNIYNGYSFKVLRKYTDGQIVLSNNYITSITQDKNKVYWIGSRNGITRFDPAVNKYQQIYVDSEDALLSDNWINSIFVDAQNNIWIATKNGISLYSNTSGWQNTDTLNQHISLLADNKEIKSIFADKNQTVWIGTALNGLLKHDVNTGNMTAFTPEDDNANSVAYAVINDIKQDHNDNLWIGTQGGVSLLKRHSNSHSFQNYITTNCLDRAYIMNVNNLYIDDNNQVFVCTWHCGLVKLNPLKNKFSKEDVFYRQKITANSIIQDNSGIYHLGTWGNGLVSYDPKLNKFNAVKNLEGYDIASVLKDSDGDLWMGTGNGKGLLRKKAGSAAFEIYTYENSKNIGFIDDQNCAYALAEDGRGNIWVGTRYGLILFKKNENRFKVFWYLKSKKDGLSWLVIRTLMIDESYLWVGTDAGLDRVNIDEAYAKPWKDVVFEHFPFVSDSSMLLSNAAIRDLDMDKHERLWIATANGLNLYNAEKGTLKQFYSDNTQNQILENYIWTVKCSDDSLVWIGTKGGGLSYYNIRTNAFTSFNKTYNLPNIDIWSIEIDPKKNVWISTNKGLVKIDPATMNFERYTTSDGLVSYGFNGGSSFCTQNGELYFGSPKGLNHFYSDSIKPSDYEPNIIVSSVYTLSKKEDSDTSVKLILPMFYADTLVLTPDQYSVTIEFAALHYANPEFIKYQFKLEGLHHNWINRVADYRKATFTNLAPGNYTLRIKATNCDGIWNDTEKKLVIVVQPPFWNTLWFKLSVLALIMLAIIGIFRLRLYRIKQHQKTLTRMVKERTAELFKKSQELEAQKEELIATTEKLSEANTQLEKLSIVASETNNAVLIMDADYNIEWVNQGFTRMFGLNLNELIQERGINLLRISGNAYIKNKLLELKKEKKTIIYEAENRTKDGVKLWVQTTITPILNEKNQITKLIAIDSDITELKAAEKEIIEQRDEIARQTKEIKDSIHYSKNIQSAILPSIEMFTSVFPESFVFFRPKEIIGGDFFWIHEAQDHVVVAAADCTGHGIPGALMSMLGITFLNDIVKSKNIVDPGEILDLMRLKIVRTLHQSIKEEGSKDGLDIALCTIYPESNKILYAGANNPAIKISKESVTKLHPDKMPVRISYKYDHPFNTKEYFYHPNDMLYLFSDGFADQFGGPKDKRFKTGKLISLLTHCSEKEPHEQLKMIEAAFTNWKKQQEQIDDVLIIGIKL